MPQIMRNEAVKSFYRMRQALGVLGLMLPLALIVGGFMWLDGMRPSISDYYHTALRDVLVGTLCAIAMFLIFYRGHARGEGERLSDDCVSTVGGIAALGVAFLPNASTDPEVGVASFSQMVVGMQAAAIGHYLSAIVFLGCLAYLNIMKFAKSANPARRRIYLWCGWLIAVMTLATIIASAFKVMGPEGPQRIVNQYMLVLWFEAIAIWAFAVSWLTKGRADVALVSLVKSVQPDAAEKGARPDADEDEARA